MKPTPQYDEKAQRWVVLPELPKCPHGDYQEPHPEAPHSQTQLYCKLYQVFVAPSGETCRKCARKQWPRSVRMFEGYKAAIKEMVERGDLKRVEDVLIHAVEHHRLSKEQAKELAQLAENPDSQD